MAKETIDVEKVVEWAYRVQCVDRQVGGLTDTVYEVSISGGLGEYVRLGTRVDNSGAATKALGLRLPDDAAIVHDAVLALGDAFLEWRARDTVELWDARLAADRGMVLLRSKSGLMIAPAYEPEETAPVPLETISTSVLIILNGRAGNRPEWHPDWRPGSRASEGEPDRREVMHARAVYLAWRLGLCRLAEALAGRLADFDVVGPEAPEAPWKVRRPRIVEDTVTRRDNQPSPRWKRR
ncbi:hypothetical protein KL86PLE_110055 [uncultured Pleomorphomonas sp.]|uniref:Uncharacterized protein n=1 Tax=uncultured Pleomorphomonas sp. TaxID=442121 RepID=A0A212L7F4_9HYPH|nr:hypothetical protein [uncultured Pleomorphomonas sp.]SCM73407.1 hypothetical protein KL86PLE_110055 [uncultured Pleomorphomonas sp.]